MAECPHLLDTSMLADGELTGEAADRAREHLASCKECQAELAGVMHLGAMPAPLPANVVPIAWYRKRSTQLAGVLVAAAAAATIIYIGRPGHGPTGGESHPTQIALAEQRPIEARLAWDGAKQYRAFSPPRGAAHGKEPISLSAMADLEKAGDQHGVGALAVLAGDYTQAQKYLAGDSAAVLADRAALELQRGDATRALALADDALAKAPGDPVATWNRALALRDLGLPHAAAEMFRAVAARGEQGWAAEAKQRAEALDRELADALARYIRISMAGAALAKDGTGVTPDDALHVPGMVRIELYDAMRAATSPEQLAKLKPIADAIDQTDHGSSAAAALAAAKPDPAVAAAYTELIAGKFDRAKVIAALRGAHADDALVVAYVKFGDGTATDADLPELEKLAASSQDPWIRLIGIEQRGANALAKGDLALAERTLLLAKPMCGAGGPGLRCMKVAWLLGRTYLKWQRLPEAKAALDEAWTRVRAIGEWAYLDGLLYAFTNLAAVADETVGGGLPLVRAYTEELGFQGAREFAAKIDFDPCDKVRWGKERVATVLFNQLRFADAARELAAAPPCTVVKRDPAAAAAGLFIRAELARATNATDAIANVKTDLAKLRDQKDVPPAVRALVDYIDGALTIGSDAKAGETLLRRAIAGASSAPDVGDAHRAVGLSYEVLATAAAKRGDAKAALAVLGEELGVTPRATCVVGVAVDDRDAIAIVRGSDGTDVIDARERTSPAIDATTAVPPKLLAALKACADVDVLARPPYHGLARLLPDDLAWRYVTARKQPAVASTATASLVVADVEPPAALALPRLAAWAPAAGATQATVLSGPAATPARVLAAIGESRDATIHAHGLADLGDAAYLALSPESDGHYALTAGDVSRAHFASSPVVILAACTAAKAAPLYHARWSLPAAFVAAGARAVIAPTVEVPDQSAAAFFAELRAKLVAGTSAATALREVRATWLTTHHEEWVRDVVVFE